MIVAVSSDPQLISQIQHQLNRWNLRLSGQFATLEALLQSNTQPELILLDVHQLSSGGASPTQFSQRTAQTPFILIKRDEEKADLLPSFPLPPVAVSQLGEVTAYTLHQIRKVPPAVSSERLAKLSHELRAPLVAISNLVALLSGTPLTPGQSEYVTSIKSSAERLLSLVNDILDYARLESARVELKNKPFNLTQVIESALNLIAIPAAQKNLDLSYRIDEDVPETLVGDPNRLGQVLTNLLTNAVKFTDAGWITVEVQRSASDLPTVAMLDATVDLVFSVRDTGIGIPPESRQAIFQPFSQLGSPKTGVESGSGLGLAICKQLVRLMGGDIWLESSGVARQGSVFSFSARFQVVHAPLSPYLQHSIPVLQNKSCLVIGKNNPSLLRLVERLAYWGASVKRMETLDQFFNPSEQIEPPDLILLDNRGVAPSDASLFADQIAQWQLKRHLAVFLLSPPNTQVQDKLRATSHQILHLPLSLPRLYRAINDVFLFASATTRPAPIAHKIHVLLVDDDVINLTVTQKALERLGQIVEVVSDGEEALKRVAEKPYDLVIMDMRMEIMDGYATTRAMRETLPAEKQPMIAILTAGVTPSQLNALQSAGIDAYLEKPITIENLMQLVDMARASNIPLRPELKSPAPRQENQASKIHKSGINPQTLINLLKVWQSTETAAGSDVYQMFTQSTDPLLIKAHESIRNNEIQTLKDALHGLRGVCEIFGAERLSQLCRDWENELSQSLSIKDSARMEEIISEYNLVQIALQSYRDHPQILDYLTNQSD